MNENPIGVKFLISLVLLGTFLNPITLVLVEELESIWKIIPILFHLGAFCISSHILFKTSLEKTLFMVFGIIGLAFVPIIKADLILGFIGLITLTVIMTKICFMCHTTISKYLLFQTDSQENK